MSSEVLPNQSMKAINERANVVNHRALSTSWHDDVGIFYRFSSSDSRKGFIDKETRTSMSTLAHRIRDKKTSWRLQVETHCCLITAATLKQSIDKKACASTTRIINLWFVIKRLAIHAIHINHSEIYGRADPDSWTVLLNLSRPRTKAKGKIEVTLNLSRWTRREHTIWAHFDSQTSIAKNLAALAV